MKFLIQLTIGICLVLFLVIYAWIDRSPESVEVVFFGDSLTKRFDWSSQFANLKVVNLGVDGDRVKNLRARFNKVRELQPKKVFLLVGINDLLEGASEQEFVDEYEQLLNQFTSSLPQSALFVQSILPVRRGVSPILIRIANEKIKGKLRREQKFVNLYPLFADQNGLLKQEFTYDGIHLNKLSYEVWVKAISESVNP